MGTLALDVSFGTVPKSLDEWISASEYDHWEMCSAL